MSTVRDDNLQWMEEALKDTAENRLKQAIKLKQKDIPGLHLFSNPRGTAKQGNAYVSFGLAPGSKDLASSDFIGWHTRTITQDMVGQKIAQFVSIEAKAISNKPSAAQRRWLDMVTDAGGRGIAIWDIDGLEESFDAT